jgi:hypothetical protein
LEEPFELEDIESDLGEEDSDPEDIENTVQDVQDDEYRQYWDDIYREKHRLTCCLSTKSSNFLYKSGNNKALLDNNSLTTNSKTG